MGFFDQLFGKRSRSDPIPSAPSPTATPLQTAREEEMVQARELIAINTAAVRKIRRGIPDASLEEIMTMLLAIEFGTRSEFIQGVGDTLLLSAQREANISSMCIYEHRMGSVIVTDGPVDKPGYKLVGHASPKWYEMGLCQKCGLDPRRLRIRT